MARFNDGQDGIFWHMNDVFARGWLNADEYGDIKAPHLFVEAGQLMARRVVESGYRCQPMRGWEVESGFLGMESDLWAPSSEGKAA